MEPYSTIAHLIIWAGGLFACWTIYRTLRAAWPKIMEILDVEEE